MQIYRDLRDGEFDQDEDKIIRRRFGKGEAALLEKNRSGTSESLGGSIVPAETIRDLEATQQRFAKVAAQVQAQQQDLVDSLPDASSATQSAAAATETDKSMLKELQKQTLGIRELIVATREENNRGLRAGAF